MAEYYTKAESDARYAGTSHTHALESMGGNNLPADRVEVPESVSASFGNAYTMDEALESIADQFSGKASTSHTHTGYAAAEHTHDYAAADHTHSGYAADTHTHTPADIGAAAASHTHDYAAADHTHDYAASAHTHTPASIGAAAASHTHDYAASNHTHTGYADEDHTHTASEVGAASSSHTHTPASIGAAAASHTHDYADADHTHTASEVGAAASSHTHTPASIGAAASSHTHSGYAASSHTHDYADSDHTHSAADVGALPASGGTVNGALTVTGNGTIRGKAYTQQILPMDAGSYSIGASDNRYYSTYLRVNPNVSSDRRCKRDIEAMDIDALAAFVNKLSVVNYNYNDDAADEAKRIGLIAQDVVAADPTIANGCVEMCEDGFYGLRAADLVFPLIAAVQALTKRVEELEGK